MRRAARSFLTLALAVALVGATPRVAPAGFVDLPKALAAHPLQAVLAGYDRGIAALRSTRSLPGLAEPAARAQNEAAALQRDANLARSRVAQIATFDAGQGQARERDALAAVLASHNAADTEMDAYRNELARATAANLAAYEESIAQRNERALAARQQQLLEQELTLAFNLARQHGGQRFILTLKLRELHLDKERREQLEAELSALNRSEANAVAMMRRTNTAILERYREDLQRDGADANARMAARLRSTAAANLTLRLQVLQAEARTAAMLPNFPMALASFAASYRSGSDAAAIVDGLRSASRELSQRFTQLGDAARRSQRETAAQIATVTANRDSLYRSMIAQIQRDAQRIARERGLTGVVVAGARPKDSVDLTPAIEADLARF
ncbi:MAG: hypothetical protein WBE79_03280 [Candidatus Cybelea sp.]